MHAIRALPLAALALALAIFAFSDTPRAHAGPEDLYTVSGRVCATPLPACAPLKGVIVTLEPFGPFTQTSLANGTFAFTGTRVGIYALSVSFSCTTTQCYAPLQVAVATGNVNVDIVPCTDSDADDMCTSWETARSCMTPATADDLDDPDLDTVINIVEYEIGTNPCDPDTDNDGCSEIEELDIFKEQGGDRNPLDPADFFDVAGNDQRVDLSDALLILGHFGHGPNDDALDNALDRWSPDSDIQHRTAFHDNGIDLTDAISALAGFGDDCNDFP